MKKLFLMMLFIIAGVTYMHAQQSYVTSKKTTVTTEKYNKSKIVALQWINLRIESYLKFLQVYELNPQTGKWEEKQYIPRNKPGTYSFPKTMIWHETLPRKYVSHTIKVTVTNPNEGAGVSVTMNGSVKEFFSLKP